jgi:uncharacterized RDD family membrane protein YckC
MYNYPPPQQPQYMPYQQMGVPPYALPKAGFWVRFGAYLVDGFIIGVIVNVLVWIPLLIWFAILSGKYGEQIVSRCGSSDLINSTCDISGIISDGDVVGLVITMVIVGLVATIFSLLYYVLGTAKGATLGKKVFGLRVIKVDGRAPGFGTALLRQTIGYFVSGVIFYLGFIWIGLDANKQGWHDKISATFVVKV